MIKKTDDPGKEKATISVMVRIYCSGHHRAEGEGLCADCRQLLDYAFMRLNGCKFGSQKPVCSKCTVHCYKPQMREKIRKVMRYAGPRMLLRHPVKAIRHLFVSHKSPVVKT